MKLASGYLTFCSNIYAGESWADHFLALQNSFPSIKSKVSPDKPMGLGLRLSNIASIEILQGNNLQEFIQWLNDNDAYVFTMNGFPYGGFHHIRVKDQVHAPDWTTNERLDYTLRLFHILAKLLPQGMEGGISTSPLSYKPWFETPADRQQAMNTATVNVLKVAAELCRIRQETGVLMHLDIEPEPDGFLESGPEFIDWFENELLAKGTDKDMLRDHICLCYDVCHFAIGYEPHYKIIKLLSEKRIKVGKIQISAALKGLLPSALKEREAIVNEFSKFDEPTYLHQVVAKTTDGALIRYNDLPAALADSNNPLVTEWRAHFHVPIFTEDLGLVKSTRADIVQVLEIYKNTPFTQHLEVETYTWEVLPGALKAPLSESITRELEWVKTKIF